MLLPYSVDVPMERVPFTNWLLIAATVFSSFAILIDQGRKVTEYSRKDDAELKRIYEQLMQPGVSKEKQNELLQELEERKHEAMERLVEDVVPAWSLRPGKHFSVLQLFSYQFVHGGIFHLVGNMLFLFVFGNAVNAKLGHLQFLVAYLLLGALGGLAWMLLGNGMPLVGASGSIMGIVGIFLILFPQNDVSVLYFGFAGGGTFRFSSGWLILMYVVGDLVGCLRMASGGGVAYVTHVGSTVGGVALGVTLVWLRVVRPTAYERNLLQVFGLEPPAPRKKKRRKRKKDAGAPPAQDAPGEEDTSPVAEAGHPEVLADALATEAEEPPRPRRSVLAELADDPNFDGVQLLGPGALGPVFSARHKAMDRPVLLKVLNPQFVADEKTARRLRREVEAAARLQHPNIAGVYGAGLAGDRHFVVAEVVDGTDLARYVQRKGLLPAAHACHFVRQAAKALQHAHEHGQVHRDIKPQNLLLTPAGVVKVLDFGLAPVVRAALESGPTDDNLPPGTADYLAPEQVQDPRTADTRADVYSLGCALFHLLTGRPPFKGNTVEQKVAAHRTAKVPLEKLPEATPDGLRAALKKMTDKDPASRFQTPGEVVQTLKRFLQKSAGAN